MLKVESLCVIDRIVTVKYNNEAFQCECNREVDIENLTVGEYYEFTTDNNGIVCEYHILPIDNDGLNEDEQHMVQRFKPNNIMAPQLVHVGAKLMFSEDGQRYDVTVEHVMNLKAWVHSDISRGGDYHFVVDVNVLKSRKSSEEIEQYKRTIEREKLAYRCFVAGYVAHEMGELSCPKSWLTFKATEL